MDINMENFKAEAETEHLNARIQQLKEQQRAKEELENQEKLKSQLPQTPTEPEEPQPE